MTDVKQILLHAETVDLGKLGKNIDYKVDKAFKVEIQVTGQDCVLDIQRKLTF